MTRIATHSGSSAIPTRLCNVLCNTLCVLLIAKQFLNISEAGASINIKKTQLI